MSTKMTEEQKEKLKIASDFLAGSQQAAARTIMDYGDHIKRMGLGNHPEIKEALQTFGDEWYESTKKFTDKISKIL